MPDNEELQKRQAEVSKVLNDPAKRELVELGCLGWPGVKLAEDYAKAKRMAREALTGIMKGRMLLHVLRMGQGADKERYLMGMLEAEQYFLTAYEKTFGERFEPIMPPTGG